MRRLWLLSHSIRHTRPRQLVARAQRVVECRVSRAAVRLLGEPGPALAEAPLPLSAAPPRPVFAPRTELAVTDGATKLRFLNLDVPLVLPLDWHPAAWEHGTRLEKLHLHYMDWLAALPEEIAAAAIADWIAHNPPRRPGWWRDSWNSYALSIRCVAWMQELERRGSRMPPETRQVALRSLVAQLRFLVTHLELDIGGNHLIKNVKALLWAARFFEGDEARAWGRQGEQLLDRELDEQVLPDGMHFERSPAYHLQVLADLIECRSVLGPGALRERLDGCLARMAQVAADLTHPDGLPSLFNDGGLHMTYAPAAVLEAYARVTGAAPPRARELFALPDAGYFGWRRFDDELVLLDAGPVGPDHLPAHAHGSIFAFEWSAGGQRIAIDPGVYEYHAGPRRDWSRSTAAHNTVCVEGRDQCEFYGSFRVGRRARVRVREARLGPGHLLEVEADHDGYARLSGGPLHVRRTRVDASGIAIRDVLELRRAAARPPRASAGVLLHPEVEVAVNGTRARLSRGGLELEIEAHAPLALEAAEWAPDFGVLVPTRRLAVPLVDLRGTLRLGRR